MATDGKKPLDPRSGQMPSMLRGASAATYIVAGHDDQRCPRVTGACAFRSLPFRLLLERAPRMLTPRGRGVTDMAATTATRKRLIEVAIPLDAINAASAREKSIRHGHPSTLHLWWARRPLAACRAVLFAQLVDDPSSHPDRFPTKEAVDEERKRLFDIIEELVQWENSTNEEVLERARAEIRNSCDGELPPVYDPFSGGGSIPLEAQRLGLQAHGSDLNPVAVMIGKAMIEIPPRFKDREPVHPGPRERTHYRNAEGLAEDVKYYGEWMRERAFERIGHLYPQGGSAEGAWRRQGDGDRMDMGAHGAESGPRVHTRSCSAGTQLQSLDQEGKGGLGRTDRRRERLSFRGPVDGEGRRSAWSRRDGWPPGRHLHRVGIGDAVDVHPAAGPSRKHGCTAHGHRRGRVAQPALSSTDRRT